MVKPVATQSPTHPQENDAENDFPTLLLQQFTLAYPDLQVPEGPLHNVSRIRGFIFSGC